MRGERTWPLYPMRPGQVYVNFGFWGTVALPPGARDGYFNRRVEDKVTELGGHKGLYSTSFYPREEFWARYNGAGIRRAQAHLRSAGPARRPVRQVRARRLTVKREQEVTKEEGKGRRWLWPRCSSGSRARMPQSVSRPSTGARQGADDSPIKITVKSPTAVAYLAQAPGALGLARAYVSGHLDVEGDMYAALARMAHAQELARPAWPSG